jgi:hypothetical protein
MRDSNSTSQRKTQPKHVRRQQRQSMTDANAHRNYERYLALAREAASAGDAIQTENWYQHAEHYFRLMKERAT